MAAVLSALGAVAAAVAAVLSGLTLWVTGRREEKRWLRDELVDVFVAYLQASFRNEARAALEARQRAVDAAELDRLRVACDEAHADQMQTLTRLRLLAPSPVVIAAERLHTADHKVTDYAFQSPETTAGPIWQELRRSQKASREAVIDQARIAIGLGPGAPVAHWRGRTTGT